MRVASIAVKLLGVEISGKISLPAGWQLPVR
jgi:hypothetical protein